MSPAAADCFSAAGLFAPAALAALWLAVDPLPLTLL
jgi:hypothetical protein